MAAKQETVFRKAVTVDQDFVQGDKHTIEKLVINIYGDHAAPDFSDDDLWEQFNEYRRYIIETYKYLDFKGIDGLAEAVKGSSGVTLESVYVPLRARVDTPDGESWHRVGGRYYCGAKPMTEQDAEKLEEELERQEAEALPVEQWVKSQQALLILGDPGSGKSTSLKRLALGLVQREDAPLPVLLPLNAYSKALEKQTISFEDYLSDYFHHKRPQLEKHKLLQLFKMALEQERAVILMDGLDEVGDNRGEVVAQVESFVRAWIPDPESDKQSGNRMIVTSRFVGYRDYPLRDPRWKTVALNDWNTEEIGRFFKAFTLAAEVAWSGGENTAHTQASADKEINYLLAIIERNSGIRRLAGNPLLASLLALIKRQGVTLPHRRVELYKLYMETLLRSWNRSRSLADSPIGPSIDFSPTQRLLAKLALHLRETNPQGGLISEDAMRDYLRAYYEEDGYTRKEADEQAKDFLASVHSYSNLLIEKGHQQFGFIHLTFEEYLAGFGLALERESVLERRIPALLKKPEHWKETLLLSMGVMSVVNTNQEKANGLLEGLLVSDESEAIIFAGEVLNDVGASVLGNRMTRLIQKKLYATMVAGECDIGVRSRAGLALSESGWMPDDLNHLIKIEPGKFLRGDDKEESWIDYPYWIGKYPVTNYQYQQFVDDGGYQRREFWTDEGWETKEEQKWLYSEFQGVRRFDSPLLPVVGISQLEALAYCSWFQKNGRATFSVLDLSSSIFEENICRLPTHDEWEKAARGLVGQYYPWKGQFDSLNANSSGGWKKVKLENEGTTPVVCYPQGVSSYGLADCSGNVWEWILERNEHERVDLRGGSWATSSDSVRCMSRLALRSHLRASDVGFRIVLSPRILLSDKSSTSLLGKESLPQSIQKGIASLDAGRREAFDLDALKQAGRKLLKEQQRTKRYEGFSSTKTGRD